MNATTTRTETTPSVDSPRRQSRLGTAHVYFDLACEHQKTKFFRMAIDILEDDAPQSLDLAKNYLHMALLLGKDKECAHERDEAFKNCKRVLESFPSQAYLLDSNLADGSFKPLQVGRFWSELGEAYFHVGKLDDARLCMDMAIQLFLKCPDRDFDELSRFLCTMTRILLRLDEFHAAVVMFINAVGAANDITLELLRIFHEIESADFNWDGYNQNVRLCCEEIDLLMHIMFLNDSTEPRTLGRAHCMMGLAHCKLGNLDEAQTHTEKAIQIFGERSAQSQDSWRSHYIMARIMIERKAFKDAATLLQRATEIAHAAESMLDLATTYRDLGLVFHNQGDYKQAESLTHQAIKIQEHHRDSVLPLKLAQSYKLLGLVFESQGKFLQTVTCYQRAIEHSEGLKHVELEINRRVGLISALAARR